MARKPMAFMTQETEGVSPNAGGFDSWNLSLVSVPFNGLHGAQSADTGTSHNLSPEGTSWSPR
jgi:hypothetical protein